MALDGLTLFVAVPAADCSACCLIGEVPRRYVGDREYIGLREDIEAALERATRCSHVPDRKIYYSHSPVFIGGALVAHGRPPWTTPPNQHL